MLFNKTPATIKQQIDILRQRGWIKADEGVAEKGLTKTTIALPIILRRFLNVRVSTRTVRPLNR